MFTQRTTAAAGTLVALGALGAVAVGASSGTSTGTTSPLKAPAPIVRTVVVHRTIRIVRHGRPKTRSVVHSSPVTAPVPASAYRAPAIQVAQVQPAPTARVQTRTSGAGDAGEGERDGAEHEGGGDD